MIKISANTKFQALAEHYKDTFSNIKESIKLRDKLMVLILLVLVLLVLYTFWPADAVVTFSEITAQKLGIVANLNAEFLSSIIWFALLATVLRYTQVVVYIERQYLYIHRIEKELHKHYDDDITFTREDKSYLKKYPKFSDWVWALYMIIFPFVLAVVVLVKIISEWIVISPILSVVLVFNTAIAICILISITLYMFFMHKQK